MSGGASASSRGSSRRSGSGRPSTSSWASRQPPPPFTPYLSLQPVPSVAQASASASLRSTRTGSSSAASSHAWLEEAMDVHACCPQRIMLEDSSAAFRWAGPPASSTITMLGRERFVQHNPGDEPKKRQQLTFISKVPTNVIDVPGTVPLQLHPAQGTTTTRQNTTRHDTITITDHPH